MADQTYSKFNPGGIYLEGELESPWGRLEPLITPSQLRTRWLFGIPLVSQTVDPLTKKHFVMTDEILEQLILQSVAQVESETGAVIMPTQIRSRHPFDKALWDKYGYMELPHRPAYAIDEFIMQATDESLLMQVPLQWVDVGSLQRGLLFVIPLNMVTVPQGTPYAATNGSAGSLFLSILGAPWIPAFFTLKCSYGFPDGNIPIFINNLIGIQTAINVLGMLGATFARTQGASLAIDGTSQSFNGPGANIYVIRIQQLEDQKMKAVKKIKSLFGLTMISSNV